MEQVSAVKILFTALDFHCLVLSTFDRYYQVSVRFRYIRALHKTQQIKISYEKKLVMQRIQTGAAKFKSMCAIRCAVLSYFIVNKFYFIDYVAGWEIFSHA